MNFRDSIRSIVVTAFLFCTFDIVSAQINIPSDKEGLLKGEGMGQALYAERIGYPGPKHALELKDQLGVTKDQMKMIEELVNNVQVSASVKGEEIVDAEEDLQKDFETGTVNEKTLRSKLERIGKLRGELRFIHLQAHLKMKQILSPNQVERYKELRAHEAQ